MNDQFRRVTLTAFHANDTLKTITLHKGDDRGRIIRLVLRYCAPEEVLGVRFVLTQGEGQNTETLYQDMEPVPGEQYATFEFEAATGNVEIGLYPCAFKVSMVENHIVNTLTSKVNVVPDIAMPLDAEEMDSVIDMVTRGYDVTNLMRLALANIDITLENDGVVSVTDEDGETETFNGLKTATEQAQTINIAIDNTGIVTVTDRLGVVYVYTGLYDAITEADTVTANLNVVLSDDGVITVTDKDGVSKTFTGVKDAVQRANAAADVANENATHAGTATRRANQASEEVERIRASVSSVGVVSVTDRDGTVSSYDVASQVNTAITPKIEAADAATIAANIAAASANSAAAFANNATTSANNAALSANGAASSANLAAARADAAAEACNTWYIVEDEFHLGLTAYVDEAEQAIVIGRAS